MKRVLKPITYNLKARGGQSLIEIMIALAIGAILIGTASLGIAFILRSSTANQKLQSASGLIRDLVERIRSVSSADWQNIYGLTKGTSTAYFINASGTELIILEGKEGVLGDDISSGLVGHWKFDEVTSTASITTYDASGSGNHGTLVGGTSRAMSTCQVSHCLDFDGIDDYVDIPDYTPNFDSFTVSGWFNLNSARSGTSDPQPIFGNNQNTPFLGHRPATQEFLHLRQYTGSSQILTWTGAGNLADDTWHHVALSVDQTNYTAELFLDGVSLGNNSIGTEGYTHSNGKLVALGKDFASFFQGKIDDARTYNRALSADEVNRLYGSTVFIRYLNIENVNRDSGGDIVASGGDDDPSTQKITTYVEWTGVGSAVGQIKIVDYITRWSNRVFNQTDWSGGSGEEGPLTNPGSKYSSATSVSNPVGSIRIEGL